MMSKLGISWLDINLNAQTTENTLKRLRSTSNIVVAVQVLNDDNVRFDTAYCVQFSTPIHQQPPLIDTGMFQKFGLYFEILLD